MPARKPKKEAELFQSWLRRNGLKKTHQKDLILETFLNTEGHMSIEDIYALVKKKDRRIGNVTVFRAIKALVACGVAREVVLGDGLTRFEHHYQHPSHHHIVCTQCGQVIEFVSPELERMHDEITKEYGFHSDQHWFEACGICVDCRENRQIQADKNFPHDTRRIFARDAVKMALAMESRLLEFFRVATAANRDAEGKEVFARMSRLKEAHVAELDAQLEEIIHGEKHLAEAPIFLHYDLRKIERKIPGLARAAKEAQVSEICIGARAAMDLARFLTTTTADFFKDYAAKFPDTWGGQLLMVFAGRQEAHADY